MIRSTGLSDHAHPGCDTSLTSTNSARLILQFYPFVSPICRVSVLRSSQPLTAVILTANTANTTAYLLADRLDAMLAAGRIC